VVAERKTAVRTWLNDLGLLMSYWGGEGGRAYHHTAPVNAIYGLHEALAALFEEGMEAAIARHRRMHEALASGLAALELDFHVAKAHRLPQLNAVVVPDGIDEAAVRARMLDKFGVEIGAGLGPLKGRVWRIGVMGASATPRHVRACLVALADALSAQGRTSSSADALTAAEARF
jgi:alanine-glyoxylate transaminase/serine-glyoxylate transaminase/serine-pyruvate transaminase